MAGTGSKVGPCKVVVVDDSKDTAESLVQLLIEAGHRAIAVTDPLKAEAVIAAFGAQIAFLDIGMPILNGWELAMRLRKTFSAEVLKLVALTAYGEARDRLASRQAGFDAHLLKPADFALVEGIVRQFFSAS